MGALLFTGVLPNPLHGTVDMIGDQNFITAAQVDTSCDDIHRRRGIVELVLPQKWYRNFIAIQSTLHPKELLPQHWTVLSESWAQVK